jgi:hypothetical protein
MLPDVDPVLSNSVTATCCARAVNDQSPLSETHPSRSFPEHVTDTNVTPRTIIWAFNDLTPPDVPLSEKLCSEPEKSFPEKGSATIWKCKQPSDPEGRLVDDKREAIFTADWIHVLSRNDKDDEILDRTDRLNFRRCVEGVSGRKDSVANDSKYDRKESPAIYVMLIESVDNTISLKFGI